MSTGRRGGALPLGWWLPTAGALVFVLSLVAVHVRPAGAPVALWWPAAAVAVALTLHAPAGRLRATALVVVAASSGLANAVGGRPAAVALAFGACNACEALLVARLYGRADGSRRELDGLAALGRLVVSAGAGAVVIALGAGATVHLLLGGDALAASRSVLITHSSALLLLLPLVLLPRSCPAPRRGHELLLLLLLQAVALRLAFGGDQDLPLTSLVLVGVVLAALRLPPLVAHAYALGTVGAMAALTLAAQGPFAAAGADDPLVTVNLVQVLALVVVAVALTVALTGVERRRALLEQVALRERLADQVAFIDTLVNSLDQPVYACDATGRLTFVNEAAARLRFGGRQVQPGMLLEDWPLDGLDLADGTPASVDDLPLARALRGQVGEPVHLLLRVGAQVRHLRGSARPILGRDGSVLGAVSSGIDLTVEHALQEQLRVARDRAEALWAAAPVGVTEADTDGTTLSANEHFCRMLGYRSEELVGRPAHELVVPEQGRDVQAGFASLRDGAGYTAERVYLHAEGHGVPVQVSTAVLRDADGAVDRFAAFYVDLSQVHAQRDALAEAQRVGRLGSFRLDPTDLQPVPTLELCQLWGHATVQPASRLHGQVLEEDHDALAAAVQAGLAGDGRATATFRIRRADDGRVRTLRGSLEVERDETGAVVGGTGTHQDVTELVVAEQEALEARRYVEAVLAANPDFLFVLDLATGALEYGSPGKRVLGLTSEELVARGDDLARQLVHPDDLVRLRASTLAAQDLDDGQVMQVRVRARHTDGTWRWLSRRVTPFRRDTGGLVTHLVGISRDVTDAVLAEEQLRHTALHDPLTGLPNRALLHDRVTEALQRSAEHGHGLAVLYLDLDGFKAVNDGHGHAAGDEVLRVTAERLRACVRPQDTVARLGGDEFVLLVEVTQRHPEESQEPLRDLVEELAQRVREAVRQPVVDGPRTLHVGTSIGIRCVDAPASRSLTVEEVLGDADAAMYEVKGRGKDGHSVFGSRTGGTGARLPLPRGGDRPAGAPLDGR